MLGLVFLLWANTFETSFRAGLIALNQNNLTLAQRELEAASRLQPKDARVWLALAQTYSKLRKQPQAATAARNAEAYASDGILLHGLAIYYLEAGNQSKAADLEARYAVKAPEAAPRAVELCLRAGKPETALQVARSVPAAQIDEQTYFALTEALLKKEDFAGAIQSADLGRKRFPRSAQLELAAGVAYYGLRRFGEAVESFLRTTQLDPSVEQPYLFLGRMLDQAQDKRPQITEAFAAFHKARPTNPLSSFLYGKALSLEDPVRAEALLRDSIARDPSHWESHFELGVLLERRRQFDAALREMLRSVELNPNAAAPHYRLARLYDRLGRTAEAAAERELHAKLTADGTR